MKIVCDNCATKYSIADEKVRGKVFKIRCKKCSHIIVVRGGNEGAAEAATREPEPTAFAAEPKTVAAGTPSALAGFAGGESIWHVVIDREQLGPFSALEVRAKFAAGEVDPETYAWREGFADWLRLGSIEDFQDLVPAGDRPDDNATRRSDAADLFGQTTSEPAEEPASRDSADLFGGLANPGAQAAEAPATAQGSEDLFGSSGGGLFGAPTANEPAGRPARSSGHEMQTSASNGEDPRVDVQPMMTGQRNENSVLFSLNNLQALAGGGASPTKGVESRPGYASSQNEGSGLIDIRAMAASTLAAAPPSLGSSRPDELPGFGNAPVFSAMAAPILMPSAPAGMPKFMWIVIGLGGVAVIAFIVMGVLLLNRPATMVANTPPSTAVTPTAPIPSPTTPAPAPKGAAPETAAPVAAAAKPDTSKNPEGSPEDKAHKTPRVAHAAKAPKPTVETAPPPTAAPPVAAAVPEHKKHHDDLDDLLNSASPGETKPKHHEETAVAAHPASDLPDQLGKGEIVSGMAKVKPKVMSCNDQYKVPGIVNVVLTIANSGRVQSASVTGSFAGTPTGDCVAKAVKSASFPPFKGSNQSINYPYILR